MTFATITEIKEANRASGYHWFDGNTMGFFRSRTESPVYAGRYFVTSESMGYDYPRRYSVRRANADGSIDTMGEFDMFTTRKDACAFARKLADHPDGERTHEVTKRHHDGYLARVVGPCTLIEAAIIATELNDRTNVYGIPEGGMIYGIAPDRYAKEGE